MTIDTQTRKEQLQQRRADIVDQIALYTIIIDDYEERRQKLADEWGAVQEELTEL